MLKCLAATALMAGSALSVTHANRRCPAQGMGHRSLRQVHVARRGLGGVPPHQWRRHQRREVYCPTGSPGAARADPARHHRALWAEQRNGRLAPASTKRHTITR